MERVVPVPNGTRVRNGIRLLAPVLTLLVVLGPSYGISRKDRFWEKVDVVRILDAGRPHQGPASDQEFEQTIRSNFRFVYFNALRQDVFLAMPKPENVVVRIARAFELTETIRALVDKGRGLPADCPANVRKDLAAEVAQCSEELYETFHDFFAECHQNRFECRLSVDSQDPRVVFPEYLKECESISEMLDTEIERYFLNPSPGIVNVSDYQRVSIEVLSSSLRRLSLEVVKAFD